MTSATRDPTVVDLGGRPDATRAATRDPTVVELVTATRLSWCGALLEQLAKTYRRNDEVFSEFEDAWYDSTENVEVLMHRYVLASPEAFR